MTNPAIVQASTSPSPICLDALAAAEETLSYWQEWGEIASDGYDAATTGYFNKLDGLTQDLYAVTAQRDQAWSDFELAASMCRDGVG